MIAYLVVTGAADGYIYPHLFSTEEKANAYAENSDAYRGYPRSIDIDEQGIWLYFSGSEDGYADVKTFDDAEEAETYAKSRRKGGYTHDYEEGVIHLMVYDIDEKNEEDDE